MDYLCGLDLGQAQDYSALVITERQEPVRDTSLPPSTPRPQARYNIRHIQRWQLGTAYPAIVKDVATLMARHPLGANSKLIVDYTGVGRPLVDMIKQAGLHPVAVSIHGGDRVTNDGMDYRVPKRDLVGIVSVLLQQQRLQIAAGLSQTPILTHELLNFKVKIDPATAHDSYSAWREQDHDDLVLALALAVWWGEAHGGKRAGVLRLVGY